ncbi:MAG TPA: DUF2959 domain-containing protein [Methylomirabilota bacterium]|nr:DUF2959 domain-containing protein [Methylomirabilota bacterium]
MRKLGFGSVWSLLITFTLFTSGCRSTYYATMEKFGVHKRDMLKENVEEARDEQKEAATEFKDALTRLKELSGYTGGDLEKVYSRLKGDFDRCKTQADDVSKKIKDVESVSADLFKEWEKEIQSMQNATLASSSRSKLQETRTRYQSLHAAMKQAETSMQPVLTQFNDQVLYLKHNLNAAAVGNLKTTAQEIEREVQRLIQDMNRSISEADEFIKGLPDTAS